MLVGRCRLCGALMVALVCIAGIMIVLSRIMLPGNSLDVVGGRLLDVVAEKGHGRQVFTKAPDGLSDLSRAEAGTRDFELRIEVSPSWLAGYLDEQAQVMLRQESSGAEYGLLLDGLSGVRTVPSGTYLASSFAAQEWEFLFEAEAPASEAFPVLRLRLLDTTCFLVEAIDADTSQAVREVELWDLDDDFEIAGRSALSEARTEGRAGSSDGVWMAVRTPPATGAYQARSAGYGGHSFARAPFVRVVRVPMRRMAALTVRLAGGDAEPEEAQQRYSLTLQSMHPNLGVGVVHRTETSRWEGAIEWEELPPGTYRLQVGRPAVLGAGPVLAQEELVLFPGENRRIELWPETREPETSSARVVLLAPELDSEVRARLRIELQEDVGGKWRTIGGEAILQWTVPSLEPVLERIYDGISAGIHRFRLYPAGLVEEVMLLPGALHEVIFDLHHLTGVHVELVSSVDGVQHCGVVWGYEDEGCEVAGSVRARTGRACRILCDARPIWLQATGHGVASERIPYDVVPNGANVVVLELHPELGAVVEMTLDPPQIVIDEGFWTRVSFTPSRSDGRCDRIAVSLPDPSARFSGQAHAVGRFILSSAGTYRIEYEDARGGLRTISFEAQSGIQRLVVPFE